MLNNKINSQSKNKPHTRSEDGWIQLTYFWTMFTFYTPPPENTRNFFWCLQEVQNGNIVHKWVNLSRPSLRWREKL